nr:hypothetical protein [uncultured Albidiferax sp.]
MKAALVVLLLVALTAWLGYSLKRSSTRLSPRRKAAQAQFRATKVAAADARYALDGANATIAKEEETTGASDGSDFGYVLTIFACNAYGEYFMFKSGNTVPYVKHMSHAVAKAALKEKYLPPPAN